ncbi:MAG: fumarate hydratase [Endomicrobiaceae bacterium]|nr:fumarate hydratase [Endomicrobiaceae bacterium]MDD3921938.1 fumarate hydratase [Endomicrobiaceae bacterium]
MREINSKDIILQVEKMCADINYNLPSDVTACIEAIVKNDKTISDNILQEILQNVKIAQKEAVALCQDTGTANFFIKIGKDVNIIGDDINISINKGVERGYKKYFLRKSIVSDPIDRINTQTNTPSNIYFDFVDGDKIEITMLAKGGGSENASALKMLVPSEGWKGIKQFVIEAIKQKGANACPPLIVGVGIGGDFASVGLLAKKALLREIGSNNISKDYSDRENELLEEINKLGIGPMGLGGKITALAAFIETKPCHIASLPVAVNIQCHSCRRKTIIL